MFDLLPLRPQDIQKLLRDLTLNPLLAALFLISPPDALNYMGFRVIAALFEHLRPTTESDIARVQLLIQALNQGRTTLEEAQVIQPATPVDNPLPWPAVELVPVDARPDVQLSVSKATLQHILASYTQHTFKGQEFIIPTQRWGDVRAVGETLSLDLTPGQARIVATFQGQALLRMPLPLGRRFDLGRIDSPIVLDVLTTFSFDQDSLLAMDIRHGEIRLSRVPLPEMVARELARQLIAAIPTIPLVTMPTRFEVPGAHGNVVGTVDLKARGVRIEADSVWLEFELDHAAQVSEIV